MIILGIDPGTAITGYGVIELKQDNIKSIDCGCITTSKDLEPAQRLNKISHQLTGLIKKYRPDGLAMEELFFFKNLKTAIRVSQSQGAVLLTAARLKIPIFEYTPLQVKQAITGYGRADKIQIQKMVKQLLKLKKTPRPDDVTDALAIAICHAHSCAMLKKTS